MRRALLDCTYTYHHGGSNGIQRVVRNLAAHAGEVGRELGMECLPVICLNGRWLRLTRPLGVRAAPYMRLGAWLIQPFRRFVRHPPPAAEGAPRPPAGPPAVSWPLRWAQRLLCLWGALRGQEVKPGRGDLLLLVDSTWFTPWWSRIEEARSRGCKVGAVVYDLIPVQTPELCDGVLNGQFAGWIDWIVPRADFFMAISQAVQGDVRARVAAPVGWFHLGQGLDRPNGQPVRREVREAMAGGGTYLMVGNVERRKNHALVLEALGRERLCVVGGRGSDMEALLERLNADPRVTVFHDLNDAELDYCYRHARALIAASTHEGFGLTPIEALTRGLPVLASDIPAHREVAGDHCDYFASPAELAQKLAEGRHRQPRDFAWMSWKDSCRQLIERAYALSIQR